MRPRATSVAAIRHGAADATTSAIPSSHERAGRHHPPLRDAPHRPRLDRSTSFYRDVVGLQLALRDPGVGAAFFWIGSPGQAMLGLWAAGSAPIGLSLHLALAASLEDVLDAPSRLRQLGVAPLSFDAAEASEPSVIG